MFYNILLIVQILISIGIIALVLMQHGKGADAGAAFGSGASGTVFGAAGSGNFLSRATAILATVFFLNSLTLAWLVSGGPTESGSVMQSLQVEESAPVVNSEVPVVPGQDAGATEQSSEVPTPQSAPQSSGEVPAAPVAETPKVETETKQE